MNIKLCQSVIPTWLNFKISRKRAISALSSLMMLSLGSSITIGLETINLARCPKRSVFTVSL